jgi:Na+/proline symporter
LSKRANSKGIFVGVLTGVVTNIFLWLSIKELFWMWWNLTGLIVSVATTYIVSLMTSAPRQDQIDEYTLSGSKMFKQEKKWIKTYVALAIYFVFILTFMILVQKFAVGR